MNRMPASIKALFSLVAVMMQLAPASALVMRVDGDRATLSGPIVPGDGAAFATFLAESPGIRTVFLNSSGGKVLEGIAIGRSVRRAGLSTAVDAHGARCDSACTLIFIAGTRRFYVGGGDIFEGMSGRTGLGFHTAHRPAGYRETATLNEHGSDNIRRFYAEMGAGRAAELVDKAAFNSLFRPSGRTALDLGIATSLQAP